MHLGFGELILIFIVILLIFGSSKLPALGDALGRGIKNFKKSISGEDEIDVTPKPQQAAAPPAPPNKIPAGAPPAPAEKK